MFTEYIPLVFAVGVSSGVAATFAVRKHLRGSRLDANDKGTSATDVASNPAGDNDSLFRELAEGVPVGIFTTDKFGHCVFVNPRYCEMSGQCIQMLPNPVDCVFSGRASCRKDCSYKHSASGGGWREAIHDEDLAEVQDRWAALLALGTPFTHEYRMRRSDGATTWVQARAQRQLQSSGESIRYVCYLIDITASKLAEKEVQQLAFFDTLTGLPNRRLLNERIKQAVAGSMRTGSFGALLYLDLDNFKQVNDTRGHAVGDMLLMEVAQRLSASVREGDMVARLGGDEFLVVLENLGKCQSDAGVQAEAIAEKILVKLNVPYLLAGVEHHNSPSIGLTLIGSERMSADELMKRADMAMYQSKASGRNTVRFYDPEMQALVAARAALENDLRHAIANGAFELHYQPQFSAAHAITGVEAFIRWNHQERGWISPAAFIPLAEETGLMPALGQWVMHTACQQLAQWATSPLTSSLSLSVKVSGQHFRQADFVERVLAIVASTNADPKLLKLDLNESLLLADIEDIVFKTRILTGHGIGCSLADLGTGYSSLSHLKRLSLEQLRIDQTFVQGLLTEPNDAAVTRSILALAQSLGVKVSAEGVETQEQHDMLAAFGCDAFQGYFFGQPLPVAQFEQNLRDKFKV